MKRIRYKHNKKRNTAFLYESLVYELSKNVVQKNAKAKNQILSILKEFFKKGTALREELELYKSIYETEKVDIYLADKIIQEAKKVYKNSPIKRRIFKEQTKLINTINKEGKSSVFKNFVLLSKSL